MKSSLVFSVLVLTLGFIVTHPADANTEWEVRSSLIAMQISPGPGNPDPDAGDLRVKVRSLNVLRVISHDPGAPELLRLERASLFFDARHFSSGCQSDWFLTTDSGPLTRTCPLGTIINHCESGTWQSSATGNRITAFPGLNLVTRTSSSFPRTIMCLCD